MNAEPQTIETTDWDARVADALAALEALPPEERVQIAENDSEIAEEALIEGEEGEGEAVLLAALPVAEGLAIATAAAAAASPEAALAPEAGVEGGAANNADAGGSSAAVDRIDDYIFGNEFGVHPRGPFEGLPRPGLELPEETQGPIEEDEEPPVERAEPEPPTTIDYDPNPEPDPDDPCDDPDDPDDPDYPGPDYPQLDEPNPNPEAQDPINPQDLLLDDQSLDLSSLEEPSDNPDEPQAPTDGPQDDGPFGDGPIPCPGPIEPFVDTGLIGYDDGGIIA